MNDPLAADYPTPYYAVVFSSVATGEDTDGYQRMAARMQELAEQQPGYLGIESTRGDDGVGITVSYWRDEDSIRNWHSVAEHREAQRLGREKWYRRFRLRVCRVERAYGLDGSD